MALATKIAIVLLIADYFIENRRNNLDVEIFVQIIGPFLKVFQKLVVAISE